MFPSENSFLYLPLSFCLAYNCSNRLSVKGRRGLIGPCIFLPSPIFRLPIYKIPTFRLYWHQFQSSCFENAQNIRRFTSTQTHFLGKKIEGTRPDFGNVERNRVRECVSACCPCSIILPFFSFRFLSCWGPDPNRSCFTRKAQHRT